MLRAALVSLIQVKYEHNRLIDGRGHFSGGAPLWSRIGSKHLWPTSLYAFWTHRGEPAPDPDDVQLKDDLQARKVIIFRETGERQRR